MKYYIKIALQHLSMGLIIPISVVWKLQNGLSLPEAILTESIVLFVTAIADLPAGFIANATNNKKSLVLGAFFHLMGMLFYLFGGSLVVFIVSAIFTGIAWAFVSGADEAYLHDDYLEDKSQYRKSFSTATIVDEVFTIIGMLLASLFIVLDADLQFLFVLAVISLLAHLIYTVVYLPSSAAKLPVTHPVKLTSKLSLNLIKNMKVISILPLMLAFAFIHEAGRPLWQPQLQELGIDIASFGVLFALFKLCSIGGSLLSRDREFNTRDLFAVLMVMLLSLLAFGLSFKVVSVLSLCVYLFTENYFRVYISSTLNQKITHNRAAILSLGSVVRNTVGALILMGAGVFSSQSIFIALLFVVVLKVPAVVYILASRRAYQ